MERGILTLGSADSPLIVNYWNSQKALQMYNQNFEKQNSTVLFRGDSSPKCILLHNDSITQVLEYDQKILEENNNLGYNVKGAFPYLKYHPKSFLSLKPQPVDLFCDELFMLGYEDKESLEELEEKVRYFAEECDFFSAVQVVDDFSAFYSGLFNRLLSEHFADEYPKIDIFNYKPYQYNKYSEDDSLISSLELFSLANLCNSHQRVCSIPIGVGFQAGEWSAHDYSKASVDSMGLSILGLESSHDTYGICSLEVGFIPEYSDKELNLVMDLFDYGIPNANSKSISDDQIIYGFRNRDGYVAHNYCYSLTNQSPKITKYLDTLLRSSKSHFYSKHNLDKEVLESIHKLLDL
jgi:hypothetical protein